MYFLHGMMVYAYNPSSGKAEGLWVWGHPELYNEFKSSLDYTVSPLFKNGVFSETAYIKPKAQSKCLKSENSSLLLTSLKSSTFSSILHLAGLLGWSREAVTQVRLTNSGCHPNGRTGYTHYILVEKSSQQLHDSEKVISTSSASVSFCETQAWW